MAKHMEVTHTITFTNSDIRKTLAKMGFVADERACDTIARFLTEDFKYMLCESKSMDEYIHVYDPEEDTHELIDGVEED